MKIGVNLSQQPSSSYIHFLGEQSRESLPKRPALWVLEFFHGRVSHPYSWHLPEHVLGKNKLLQGLQHRILDPNCIPGLLM